MPKIDKVNFLLIDNIKRNNKMKIYLPESEIEISVNGDKKFAHDVALAYQSLIIRKTKDETRITDNRRLG